jgi:hypothetical protein
MIVNLTLSQSSLLHQLETFHFISNTLLDNETNKMPPKRKTTEKEKEDMSKKTRTGMCIVLFFCPYSVFMFFDRCSVFRFDFIISIVKTNISYHIRHSSV